MAQDFDPLSYTCVMYDQLNNSQRTNEFSSDRCVIESTDRINETNITNDDVKPDIKKHKVDGRTRNMSMKISQKDFPFYGCSVCNICFPSLSELDTHVSTHKDRITSYDLKIKNQMKKKKLKKGMKKNKKVKNLVKMEKELLNLDLEIKPEDGYIGMEKAGPNIDSKENDQKNLITAAPTNMTLAEVIAKKQELLNLQKIFKCFACQKQFTLSYYLKLHVRSHTDEKPYTCAECGESFITASKLGRHNKRFHLAIRYQCRICFRYFSRFEFLTRHFDNKHAEDKLEGEPYDYNAILPYLKELEDQLKEKEEQEKREKENKNNDDWGDGWPELRDSGHRDADSHDDNEDGDTESSIKMEADEEPSVAIEVVKVDGVTVDIKREEEKPCGDVEDEDVGGDGVGGDDFKDEALSDDDYFPSNSWAVTPKEEPEPPPAPVGLECPVCHKRVKSTSYMRVHMRTHSGERAHPCPVCGRAFITASKMHRHALTHPEAWEDDVKSEVKSEKEDGIKDNKRTRLKKALAKLAKKKEKKKMYRRRPNSCEYCHKRFLHLETLQIHKMSHEGEPLVYKCHYCLAEVADAAALQEHESTHQGPKPYQCTQCGKCYKKRETMIYHRKSHQSSREYICDVCTKSFDSPAKLQRHLTSHRAPRYVLRYECPVCAHMFNTKYHVRMHLATHQREGLIQEENRNEILAMVLQNARKIPKQPDAPANLTAAVPADEQSRMCNICGEMFQHFYYLEEHIKSHGSKIAIEDSQEKEEKKHICTVCNKGFKLHYYLKLHSFTHTKEKPFICQQCGKGFITRGKLKRHLETHSGLKKYQCHICYKFFTRPSYLRIHVRTIHGTQDYNFRFDSSRSEEFGGGSLIDV